VKEAEVVAAAKINWGAEGLAGFLNMPSSNEFDQGKTRGKGPSIASS
jgi:hypothetical protein